MAIAFVASSIGNNNNSTTTSITLPTGFNSAGNVTIVSFVQAFNAGSQPIFTAPAGWTVLLSSGGALVVYRVWQSGDASSITGTSNTSQWWISTADTYSGCNTTTPIDNFSSAIYALRDSTTFYRSPQLNPNYSNSMLIAGFTNTSSSGGSWSGPPSGFTARGNSGSGPMVWTGEKALTDGTATSDQTITGRNDANVHVGYQIALRQAGATAATPANPYPYIAGLQSAGAASITSFTGALDQLNVQNNDMVVFVFTGPGSWSTPSGYTKQINTTGAQTYTHLWLTGDSTAPNFTSAAAYTGVGIYLVRSMGVSAGYVAVSVDSVTGNSTSGTSPVTGTTSSVTPAGANELLLCLFGVSVSGGTVTWSAISGGLTQEINSSAVLLVTGHVLPAASPTGTFSATDTGSSGTFVVEAIAALFNVPSTVTFKRRLVVTAT